MSEMVSFSDSHLGLEWVTSSRSSLNGSQRNKLKIYEAGMKLNLILKKVQTSIDIFDNVHKVQCCSQARACGIYPK